VRPFEKQEGEFTKPHVFGALSARSVKTIRKATNSRRKVGRTRAFSILVKLADIFDLGPFDQSVSNVEELHDEHDR
jgi:hypothetical protein